MEQDRRLSISTLSIIVILAAIITTALLYFFGPQTSTKKVTTVSSSKSLLNYFPAAGNRSDNPEKIIKIGSDEGTSSPNYIATTSRNTEILPTTSKLFKITEDPVAGATFTSLGGTSSAYYVVRATGHLYQVLAETRQTTRLTGTTIPLTQDMFWGKDGNDIRVVLRSLKNDSLINFSGIVKINSATTTAGGLIIGEIKGGNWPNGIVSIAVSPEKNRIFTLRQSGSSIIGVVSDWNLKEKKSIFTTENSEWLVNWPTKDSILITSKPSSELSGISLLLNTKTGSLKELLAGIKGLTINLSPDGSKLIYSESKGSDFTTKIYDLKNKKTSVLNFKTLPEKCLWSKNGILLFCAVPNTVRSAAYPDSWYRGEIAFSDSLWRFNVETGETKLLINTAESNLTINSIDIVEPFLDTNEKTIYFINKTDGTFWLFKLD